jgi:hypothetical protein
MAFQIERASSCVASSGRLTCPWVLLLNSAIASVGTVAIE